MAQVERFTPQVQDAAGQAYEIAKRYGHNIVGGDHLFLALLEQPNGAITEGLTKLNIEKTILSRDLDRIIRSKWGRADGPEPVYITPEMNNIIERAIEESERLQKPLVSTKHILLAIARECETPVGKIVTHYRLTRKRIDDMVEEDVVNSEGQPLS